MSGTVTSRPAVDRDVDLELLSLLEAAYASVSETRKRLRALLSAFEARDDRRAAFLSVYVRTTESVAERIEREGFGDPDWVADYLVAFANRYREAVLAHETGHVDALPGAWRIAFRAADRGGASAVRLAALGVNAHVNHDLALALDDVGTATDRPTRRADHRAVTEIIAGLAEDVRSQLLARDDDAVAPPAEQVAAAVGGCRERAWGTAEALGSRLGVRRRVARWLNDATATVGARVLRDAPLDGLLAELSVEGDVAVGSDRREGPGSTSSAVDTGGVATPHQSSTSGPEPTPVTGRPST